MLTASSRWVIILKGMVYVALPHGNDTAYLQGGEVMFAADTPAVSSEGHISQFVGTSEAVFMSVATPDGQVPAHTVVHSGACGKEEVKGWRLY